MKKMKWLIFLICFPLLSAVGQSDSIRFSQPDTKDLSDLLNFSGLYAYNLDIPDAESKNERIFISLDEYNQKGLIKNLWTEDFGEIHSVRAFPSGEKRTFTTDKIQFLIKQTDGRLFKINMRTSKMGFATTIKIDSVYQHTHELRPFEQQAFKTNTKQPLFLIGSYWDVLKPDGSKTDFTRFCMERELPSDFKSDAFKSMPHYYVLSVEFRENMKK